MTDAGVPKLPSPPALDPALVGVPIVGPRREPSRVALALQGFWAESRLPAATRTLVVCGVVGAAGGVLMTGHRIGLGLALVGLAVWAPALPAMVRRRAMGDLVTAGLSIALLSMVAVRDAGWVDWLCVAVAAWAGAVAATSARSASAVVLSWISWLAGGVRAMPWVARGARTLVGTRRGQVMVALRSVALTVVLLVVFGALFASSDRVFASYLPRVDLFRLPAQVMVGLLTALVAATLAHLAVAAPSWSTARLPSGRPARLGEWLLPVAALDVMVLGFVTVQVGALLGGHRHVLETMGLTYAEYAREGFGQLAIATALTLVVVAVAARRAPREPRREHLVVRVALGALCLGSLGVVASALRRMSLYVDAFGLTRLRVFVLVVEVVLGAVLLLVMAAGVRWRAGWLPRAVVQVVAVAMLGLAVVNPDAQIVRFNTTADLEVMDTAYLQGLSADAVPTMSQLAEPLRSCLLASVSVSAPEGFADWNLGRARAATSAAVGGSGVAELSIDHPVGMSCAGA